MGFHTPVEGFDTGFHTPEEGSDMGFHTPVEGFSMGFHTAVEGSGLLTTRALQPVRTSRLKLHAKTPKTGGHRLINA